MASRTVPSWSAVTWRSAHDCPSPTALTVYRIGRPASPGVTKYACSDPGACPSGTVAPAASSACATIPPPNDRRGDDRPPRVIPVNAPSPTWERRSCRIRQQPDAGSPWVQGSFIPNGG
jgi:hypothetical protein